LRPPYSRLDICLSIRESLAFAMMTLAGPIEAGWLAFPDDFFPWIIVVVCTATITDRHGQALGETGRANAS
jgi:hypothetical protein